MIKLTTENTQKAVERCKQLKPKVKFVQDRQFAVYSSDNSNVYHFSFDVKNGEKPGNVNAKRRKKAWFVITSQQAQQRTHSGKV